VPSRSIPHVRDLPARAAAHFDKKFGIKRAGQARRTPWHVLRDNGDFRLYFFGSVLSDFGTWMQNSAQVLLAYQLAHSVLIVGLVTFAQFTSPLLLGPWAGVAADKFGGRRTLQGTQRMGPHHRRDHRRACLHVRTARAQRHRAATRPARQA
jgi:hypothetical protein